MRGGRFFGLQDKKYTCKGHAVCYWRKFAVIYNNFSVYRAKHTYSCRFVLYIGFDLHVLQQFAYELKDSILSWENQFVYLYMELECGNIRGAILWRIEHTLHKDYIYCDNHHFFSVV